MKEIPLSDPKGQGQYALVDDEDYAAVSAYTWSYDKGYAVTSTGGRKNRKRLRLHRLIIGDPPPGQVVDHIDGNRLDNRRTNLRFATATQNSQNKAPRQNTSSRFKGVHWHNRAQLWVARIFHDKISIHLGCFTSEFDAARAYNAAAIEHFGEYASLNLIPDDAEPHRYRQALPRADNRTSQYRGVSLPTRRKRWVAKIGVAGKTVILGYFDTAEAAARAYDTAAKLHHGDLAFLNFSN